MDAIDQTIDQLKIERIFITREAFIELAEMIAKGLIPVQAALNESLEC